MRLIILFLLLIVFFVMDILFGSVLLPLGDVMHTLLGAAPDDVTREIVLNYRLPKALTAILTGSALSVGGVLMQVLFRNPLAGPDVLGINSGAGLGVALFTMFGFSSIPVIGELGLVGVAIAGALSVLLCVIAVSHRIKENTSLLIIGIMIGNLAGAAVSILQSISNPDAIKLFIIWTFGSLSSVSPNQMCFMIPLILSGLIIAFLLQKDLNTLLLGDNYARSLGVNVSRIRLWIILSTALLAGTATAFTGPIAFIGVAVPHIVRGILRTTNHLKIIPGAILTGSALMLLCDIISQMPGLKMTLPINAVTAMFGAPIIIWVLIKNRNIYVK